MDDFEQLYKLYSKQLYKYLLYMTGDGNLADELLQETYYQALKSIFRFRGDSKVSTWLYQIAKNVYRKRIEKIRKEQIASIEDTEDLISLNTPELIFENKELKLNLINALNKLKEPFREIIILRSYNEHSFRELGEIFNKSENWARTNFYRAKLQLRNLLLEKEVED